MVWQGGDLEEGLKGFLNYKRSIPVRGAALFNTQLNKLLLVQGTESNSWSFPRGKISKDEDDVACACREVKEEIGFDISPYIKEDVYIERNVQGKNFKIFMCKNVPDDFPFKPIARNEIKSIVWADFKSLTKKVKNDSSKYFLVPGMIHPLINYVKKNKGEIDEAKLKLDVEIQLKSMLGIGETPSQPVNDPGREILDFIRESTAKKQLKDQQENAQNHQSLNMHIPPQMPMYPMPAFGFHPPPFQQLPLIAPFAPPPMGAMGMPSMQLPNFGMNPMMFQGPPMPVRPTQIQAPPSTDQLQRPSLSFRNDAGSKELLGLLNSKDTKPKDGSGFLSQLMGTDSNEEKQKKKITLLKRDASAEDSSSKHKNDLLALIKQHPKKVDTPSSTLEQKEEPPVSHSNNASAELLNLLKPKKPTANGDAASKTKPNTRESSPQTQGKKEKTKEKPLSKKKMKQLSSNDESAHLQAKPPSKELLELIKKSKKQNDDDAEIFEDYSDDDYYEEEEHEDNGEKFFEAQEPAAVPSAVEPVKKMRLLKRGQTLDDLKAESETTEKNESLHDTADANEIGSDLHEAHSVSTIQFSDDDEDDDDDDEDSSDETKGDILENPSTAHITVDALEASDDDDIYNAPTPQPTVKTSAGAEILDSLSRDTPTPTPTVGTNVAGNEILSILQSKPQTPVATQENINAKNDLLGLLHKSQTPQQPATPASDPSADLLAMLHKPPATQESAATPVAAPVPSQVAKDPSADLLAMLHKKPSNEPSPSSTPVSAPLRESSSPSNDLLALLKKPVKSPEPEQSASSQPPQSPPTQNVGSPANDLLSLLHKAPTPPASTNSVEASPVAAPQLEKKENPGKSLMNLLFKKK